MWPKWLKLWKLPAVVGSLCIALFCVGFESGTNECVLWAKTEL